MWWVGVGAFVVGCRLDHLEHRGLDVGQLRRLEPCASCATKDCCASTAPRRSSASVTDVKLTVPALGGMLGFGDLTILTASGPEGSDTFTTIKGAG